MIKKVQLLANDGVTEISPITSASAVKMKNGNTLTQELELTDSYTPSIHMTSQSIFKAGQGDSEDYIGQNLTGAYEECILEGSTLVNRNAEDNRDKNSIVPSASGQTITLNNTVEGDIKNATLTGNTMVNYNAEGKDRNSYSIIPTVSGQSATINGTVDGQVKGATLKGMTLVNSVNEETLKPYTIIPEAVEGQSITLNDTVDGEIGHASIKGQTLVNLFQHHSSGANFNNGIYTSYNGEWVEPVRTHIPVKRNVDYTVWAKVKTTANSIYIRLDYLGGTIATDVLLHGTVTPNQYIYIKQKIRFDNEDTIRFVLRNTYGGTVEMSEIMLIEGDYTNIDIPYFTGMASVEMPVLKATGKNLINTLPTMNYYGLTINGTQGSSSIINGSINNENVTYTDYYVVGGTTKINEYIQDYFARMNIGETIHFNSNLSNLNHYIGVKTQGSSSVTYIRNSYTKKQNDKLISMFIRFTTDVSFLNQNIDIQIEQNSIASSYEPHKSNTLTVNEEVVLRGIGNVKDELNVLTGKLTQRIGEIVLNGNEGWLDATVSNDLGYKRYSISIANESEKNDSAITTFIEAINDRLFQRTFEHHGDYEYLYLQRTEVGIKIYINSTKWSSVSELKSYLSSNPITVHCRLKTPTIKTVDLSDNVVYSYDKVTHYTCESQEGSLIPTLQVTPPTYSTMLKPSTQYTVQFDRVGSNSITVNLGGKEATTTDDKLTITTPSTLTSETVMFKGSGDTVKHIQVIEGNHVDSEIPYFTGMNNVRFGNVDLGKLFEMGTYEAYDSVNKVLPKVDNAHRIRSCITFKNVKGTFTFEATNSDYEIALQCGNTNTNARWTTEWSSKVTQSFISDHIFAIVCRKKNLDVLLVQDIHDVGLKTNLFETIDIDWQYKDSQIMITTGKNIYNSDEYPLVNKVAFGGTGDRVSWSDYEGIANYLPVKPNTTYTFSCNENRAISYGLVFYDCNKQKIGYNKLPSRTFTTPSNCYFIRFSIHTLGGATTNIQIEEGTIASSFESHKSSILSCNEEIELGGIGKYIDYLDCAKGEVVQHTDTIVLDGSLANNNISVWDMGTTYRIGIGGFSGLLDNNKIDVRCADYIFNTEYSADFEHIYHYNGVIYVFLEKSKMETPDKNGFVSYVTNNPITLRYVRKEPITRKVSLSTNTIPTYNSTTHYTCVSTQGSLIPTLHIDNKVSYEAIIKPSTKYTVLFNREVVNGSLQVDLGGTVTTVSTSVRGINRVVMTTPSTLVNETVSFIGNGNVIKDVQVLEGEIVEQVPYFDGIKSVQMPVLKTVGKNLVDNSKNQYKDIMADTGLETTPITCVVTDYIPYQYGTNHVVSLYVNGVKNSMVTWRAYDKDKNYQGTSANSNTAYVRLRYFKGSDVRSDEVLFQLERNSTVTSYEPHKSSILSSSDNIELRAIGDVKDELDVVKGELVQRVQELLITDASKFTHGFSNGEYCTFYYLTDVKSDYFEIGVLSDKYKAVQETDFNVEETHIYAMKSSDTRGSGICLQLPKTIASNVAELDTYIRANNFKVIFALSTPITKQVSINGALQTFNSTTHITCNNVGDSLIPTLHIEPLYYQTVALTTSTKYLVKFNASHSGTVSIDLGGTTLSHNAVVGENRVTITTPSVLTHELIKFTGATNTIKDVVVVEYQIGIEDWSIPYFSGMADCKMPILHNTGKNLFDLNYWSKKIIPHYDGGRPNFAVSGNVISGTVENGYYYLTMDENHGEELLKQNTIYTFSAKSSNCSTSILFFGLSGADDYIGEHSIVANSVTFKTPNRPFKVIFRFGRRGTSVGELSFRTEGIQLEENSVATSFESYRSNTIYTSNHNDNKTLVLRSLPNGVKDTFNVLTGEYVQRVKEVTLNGSENWVASQPAWSDDVVDSYCVTFSDMKQGGALVCNNYSFHSYRDVMNNVNGREYIATASSYIVLGVNKSKLSVQNVSGFKQYLQQNPVKVQYELAEPIVTTVNTSYTLEDLEDDVVLPNGVKNELDKATGVFTKRVGKIVLDGSQDWTMQVPIVETPSVYGAWTTNPIIGAKYGESVDKRSLVVCDCMPSYNDQLGLIDEEFCFISSSGRLNMNILRSKLSTNTESVLKAYLQQNPITVWYELETPQIIQLHPESLRPIPFGYKDGHVMLDSNYEGDSLVPNMKYKLPISRTTQLTQQGRTLLKQEQQLSNLELLLLQGAINLDFQRTLLQLKLDLR